jgi:hypothetical protein
MLIFTRRTLRLPADNPDVFKLRLARTSTLLANTRGDSPNPFSP